MWSYIFMYLVIYNFAETSANNDRSSRNDDVFVWWRINKERFPLIAEGARILSIPASSVNTWTNISELIPVCEV
uniref:HAT C-terminal dimerisation domain-containing protein n=1 Tax=Acrobeloides nanus TaxID=290746 RepID=A0A914DX48_9BILA